MIASATLEPRAPSLQITGLTKRYGTFTALDGVSLHVKHGAFHALLGENGAGKSTLVKCVIGYERPSAGEVTLNGYGVAFDSPRAAHAASVGMVYQRFTLVENMSVAENLVAVRDHVPFAIDWKHEKRELSAFLEEMPFRLPLDARVSNLSAGEKQKLEILRQLYLRRTLLFLDEPTSVLTPSEADEVLGFLHGMTRLGQLTVLLITHKFREVSAFADSVSVLRRGKLVGGGSMRDLDTTTLAKWMVGDQSLRAPAARAAAAPGPARLCVRELEADDDTGTPAVRKLSLEVRGGEIVGVAGVSGNGQRELVEVLAGQRRKASGSIEVESAPFGCTRAELRARGVHILPEVPLDNACVPEMSVSENIALRDYDLPPIQRYGCLVSRGELRKKAERLIQRFGVRAPSPMTPMRGLSGGNIQRAVLARELCEQPNVLVAANPCFGLDFAASAEIRAQLIQARNAGAAVLLISEDLDELLELSDRLCVMFNGSIVFETTPAGADAPTIGRYMAGHAQH